MPVPKLQTITTAPAIRRLQEVVCQEFLDLELPNRYTSLTKEEEFQCQVRRITSYAGKILRVMNKIPEQEGAVERRNVILFSSWMNQMDRFTSQQGLRPLQHTPRCISRECFVYGCQFHATNDLYSVRVYRNYLDIVNGSDGTIKEVYYLHIPRYSLRY